MDELIRQHKVIVCAGSGGVGKTTIAAALAVRAAHLGLKVLVLTIDPAQRLKTALGLEGSVSGYRLVPEQKFSGQLYAEMVIAQVAFDEFVRSHLQSEESVHRLLNNPLYRQLTTHLSGSQEFTSLQRLYTAVQSGDFDLVVLDTPPTQHAIDFLHAPERLFALFQKSITRWFSFPKKSDGLWASLMAKGTKTVFSAFERVTGSEFIQQLANFFQSVEELQETISDLSVGTHRLLLSQQTAFVLVTGYDPIKLKEAEYFRQQLDRGGYKLTTILVNRAFPDWFIQGVPCAPQENHPLAALFKQTLDYYSERAAVVEAFKRRIEGSIEVVTLPDSDHEVYGLEGLGFLGQIMHNRWSL